jgi:hypothetical protein
MKITHVEAIPLTTPLPRCPGHFPKHLPGDFDLPGQN